MDAQNLPFCSAITLLRLYIESPIHIRSERTIRAVLLCKLTVFFFATVNLTYFTSGSYFAALLIWVNFSPSSFIQLVTGYERMPLPSFISQIPSHLSCYPPLSSITTVFSTLWNFFALIMNEIFTEAISSRRNKELMLTFSISNCKRYSGPI